MPPGKLPTLQVSPLGWSGKGEKQPQEIHKTNFSSHGNVVDHFPLVDLWE